MVADAEPTSVPSDDRGFLLGDALFETVALHRGRPFRLDRHLRRLEEGARIVGIRVPSDLEVRVAEAVVRAAGRDAGLRITLSRGSGSGLAPGGAEHGAPGRLVIALREMPRATDPSGLSAAIRGRIDDQALTAGLKASGYLERIQALRLALADGHDEALLRNTKGHIVEGTASNLFAVLEGSMLAPGPADGALPGVTREAILELAGEAGIGFEERGLSPEELGDAEELFLSSSLRGMVPLARVEGVLVGGGAPGPVFTRLRDAFRNLVGRETGQDPEGQPSP